ncbi:MAG: hypothetical protein OEP48_08015 [Betaproteobacteria bacterium]|nr:hypothetical protein [Betaproteobacteria bacterium]
MAVMGVGASRAKPRHEGRLYNESLNAKIAKENNSLTAKAAEDAKDNKSLNAKDAKGIMMNA